VEKDSFLIPAKIRIKNRVSYGSVIPRIHADIQRNLETQGMVWAEDLGGTIKKQDYRKRGVSASKNLQQKLLRRERVRRNGGEEDVG